MVEVEPSRVSLNPDFKNSVFKILEMRQVGLGSYIGCSNEIIGNLYNRMDKYQWEKRPNHVNEHGGIFNLEFSKDGHLLLAACEKNSILIYDSTSQKRVKTLKNAHSNCVNCIRFLTERQFATCSDDYTIKLWDTRNMKRFTNTLHGHSNWVKNIEYSETENLMVTSAFDGSIYSWDLNCPTENSCIYNKVFKMSGLMRTKLTPDGTKMVISTTSGYLIIIHDLNLAKLAADTHAFRPVIYRLMQLSGQSFPAGAVFNYLFSPNRRRNRIEFVDDFPIDAEVISSLQIHPHAWNCVSRSLSVSLEEEVTCVHDIQKRDVFQYETCKNCLKEDGENVLNSDSDEGDVSNSNQIPTDLWMGYTPHFHYANSNANDLYTSENLQSPTMGIISSGLIGRNNYIEHNPMTPEELKKIVVNLKRLTHSAKEKNLGQGYIKELCYSADGRVVCSPFGCGVRLLGFSPNYDEISYCVPDKPAELTSLVELENYHKAIVVSCKFSPTDLTLVSGCLKGDVVWYKPVL